MARSVSPEWILCACGQMIECLPDHKGKHNTGREESHKKDSLALQRIFFGIHGNQECFQQLLCIDPFCIGAALEQEG